MKAYLYTIQCLTNLHVGSGDINFNVVDNEVEKDPVTGYPMIHASGLKGALRDHCQNGGEGKAVEEAVEKLFGTAATKDKSDTAGRLKFLDAYMLARPMRLAGCSDAASVLVTTVEAINQYIGWRKAFDPSYSAEPITAPGFGNAAFMISPALEGAKVEGDETGTLDKDSATCKTVHDILGTENFALAKDLSEYPLPVVARNYLENGISKNLWYEELVPRGTRFYFAVLDPEDNNPLTFARFVQIGGNASVGCGYCQIQLI